MSAPAEAVTPPAVSRLRAFGQPVRLWLYVSLVFGAGLALVFGPLRLAPAIAAGHVVAIPWWGIFLLVTTAELASVELPDPQDQCHLDPR